MTRDTVHTCEIRHASGLRLRVVAFRHDCRPLLADFDFIVIAQGKGKPPRVAGEATVRDFPRGLGVNGLFAHVLAGIGSTHPLRDEQGNEVPLPERTPAQWRDAAVTHLAAARECFELGGIDPPAWLPWIASLSVRPVLRNAT